MRCGLVLALAVALLFFLGGPVQGQAPAAPLPDAQQDTFIELTPASEQAIAAALKYLADTQLPSGAWNSSYGPNVGVSSLCMLAFLATGNVPQQGKYAEVLDRGLNWILSNAQTSGLICYEEGASHGPMYEHALATLLLSELYGMSERPEIPAAIQLAVSVIINAQNAEGGWRYQPYNRDADISVTVMQILALRGAQRAGMVVPSKTIEQAVQYVKRCADRGGGFLYQTGSGQPNYARTGAGVCSLEVCGEYDCDEVRRGLDYLIANIGQRVQNEHYHYGTYYAAQAVYQAKDERRWQQWFPPMREQMLSLQQPDGSWQSETGPAYATSTMVLALAIPYRYLPIYQR